MAIEAQALEPGRELDREQRVRARRSLLWTGVLLGIGTAGTLDQVLLHELLQWHTFYVHTDQYWRTFIDGLFHLAMAGLLFFGAMRLWRQRQSLGPARREGRTLAAGILLGMGGFNLYDGTVDHKILQLHPVREGVADQLPYDLAFIAVAVLLLVAGWLVWRSTRSSITLQEAAEGHTSPGRWERGRPSRRAG
jgi:uncharacterized membrane protein